MSNLRFVLDTNVVVSALLLPHSVTRRAFDTAFQRGLVLVSTTTLDELDAVLHRKKFDRYIAKELRLQFLSAFIRDTVLIDVTDVVAVCRDPKDNKFLELALSGNATAIVSGDPDLLVLDPFGYVSIVTPQTFLDQL